MHTKSSCMPVLTDVVRKLMAPLFQRSYNVTCDNYFTSFGLALKLVKKKCSLVGTLHQNRKEVPEECKKKRNYMKPKCLGMMPKRQSHSHPTSAKQHKT